MFEFLITVAVLVVIAFPVIAIIALIRSIELGRLVSDLNARLRALERQVPQQVVWTLLPAVWFARTPRVRRR